MSDLLIGVGGSGSKTVALLRREFHDRHEVPAIVTVDLHQLAEPEVTYLASDTHLLLQPQTLSQPAVQASSTPFLSPVLGRREHNFTQRLDPFLSDKPSRILVVGSIFGGVGAGVLPLLLSHIRRRVPDCTLHVFAYSYTLNSSMFPLALPGAVERQQFALRSALAMLSKSTDNKTHFYLASGVGASLDEQQHVVTNAIAQILRGEVPALDLPGTPLLLAADAITSDLTLMVSLAPGIIPGSIAFPAQVFVAIRPEHTRYRERIDELHDLMESRSAHEADFQHFFERNPEFLTGLDYDRLIPHVFLEDPAGEQLVPDFMLLPHDKSLADIVELKLPAEPLIVSTDRFPRYSAKIMAASAQMRAYKTFFADANNREAVMRRYGFSAWRPRVILLIGRLPPTGHGRVCLQELRDTYHDFDLLTYDEVIARMERLAQLHR